MAKSSTFNISVKLLTQHFNKGIKDIQRQIRGVGSFIKGAFALGSITAFGKQMMQTAMEFEDAMAKVRAVSNASDRELEMMTDEAKKLGETTRYTALEAAGALENLTRNGMTASQATQALGDTLKFAQANAISLSESADIVSNTLNMFGLKAAEATKVTDILSAAASNSATNVSLLYEALVNAAPIANTLGIGIEETTAALAAFAQRGVKGANAGTALRSALSTMIDPKIVAKMNALGVDIDENVIKTEGLIGATKRLKDANLTGSQIMETFGRKSGQAIMQIVGAYDELEMQMQIAQNSAGTTARMFEQGVGNTRKAIDTLKSTYESFLESLGNKTSGVVNGAIGYLTDLIKNFKSVGGTIANLANVVIPLFTKMVVSSMTTFKTMMAQGAAAATAFKAAIGGWVTIIATAVTWFGTYLYTSLTKVNRELKIHEDELAEARKEAETLGTKVHGLIGKLGPGTDKETLAGVVKELNELFPEFKGLITETAIEAGKTGNYEKLKGLLTEILNLENALREKKILDDIAEDYTQKISQNLQRLGKSSADVTSEHKLYAAVQERLGKVSQKEYDAVFDSLAYYIRSNIEQGNPVEKAIADVADYLRKKEIYVADKIVEDVVKSQYAGKAAEGLRKTVDLQKNATAIATETQEKLDKAEKLRLAKIRAAELDIPFDDNTTLEELEKQIEEAEKKLKKTANNLGSDADDLDDETKKIAKIEEEYQRTIENAFDDLENGYMDFSTYLDKCAQAAKTAYEKFRDIKGRGVENPYKEERTKYANAIEKNNKPAPEPLNNRVVNTKPDGLVGTNRQGPQESIDLTFLANIGLIKDWGDEFSNSIEAADTLAYSLQGLENAWDTLGNSSSTAIEKFSASIQVMKNIAAMTQGLVQILDILGVKELWEARIHEWATKKKLTDDSKSVIGSVAKAVVGAIASVVEIPVVGPILAVAAAAGILGLIAATVPKFASGGIISGGSAHGDRNIARVNSGEMILNKGQQRRLLDIANGASTGSGVGQVEFYISGKNLKGVLRNVDAANSRISGAAGL